MSAPHRLPPPAAMASLPAPSQGSSPGLGPLPHPFTGSSEETMRTWLLAKMEEERRKAEEEKTKQEEARVRQEEFKTDQRRMEQEMLRESFKYGVPPALVPLVMMGNSPRGEWVHEWIAQNMGMLQQHGQHPLSGQLAIAGPPPQASPVPTLRRETRSIHQMHQQPSVAPIVAQPTPPPPHAPQQHPMGPPSGGSGPGGALPTHYVATYQLPGTGIISRPGPQPQPPMQQSQAAPPRGSLPRINTGELQIQQVHPNVPVPMGPPPGAPGPPGPPVQHHSHQQETPAVSQSPTIFFHHWVPPNSQSAPGSSSVQATASPQRQLDSPFTHHPAPNALSGGSDYHASSPKKRKMTAAQPPQAPPQSAQPFSPQTHSLSSPAGATPRTRRGHSRQRSDTNPPPMRNFEPYSRPTTRQRRSLGAGDAPSIGEVIRSGGQPMPSYQPSAGDSGGSAGHSGSGTPQEQPHQRQQSAPPPQPSRPPSRPYSAGSDYRGPPYQPPPSQPPQDAGNDGGNAGRN
jgi:hypothetical protein